MDQKLLLALDSEQKKAPLAKKSTLFLMQIHKLAALETLEADKIAQSFLEQCIELQLFDANCLLQIATGLRQFYDGYFFDILRTKINSYYHSPFLLDQFFKPIENRDPLISLFNQMISNTPYIYEHYTTLLQNERKRKNSFLVLENTKKQKRNLAEDEKLAAHISPTGQIQFFVFTDIQCFQVWRQYLDPFSILKTQSIQNYEITSSNGPIQSKSMFFFSFLLQFPAPLLEGPLILTGPRNLDGTFQSLNQLQIEALFNFF